MLSPPFSAEHLRQQSFNRDYYGRHTKPDLANLTLLQHPRQMLPLTPFLRLCLENGALEWRSVAINGHHTHIVASVRIKPCYLSGCSIWRKKFPDRDAVVAALCNHNKEAHATGEPIVDIHPPQLQAIGGFFIANIPTNQRGG